MLLRRITQHVQNQNWFAVFIDFLIVVVGVFIGIQVANWNDERANRVLEQEYLERIYFDTVRIINDLDDELEWSSEQETAQKMILDSLINKQLKPEDVELFERGLAFFGYYPIDNTDLIAVNELQSSGRMNIISDVQLRELIGITLQEINTTQRSSRHLKEIRRKHLSEVGSHWLFIESDQEAMGVTKISYNFEELSNNQQFINRLSQMKLMFEVQKSNAQEDKSSIQSLQDAVIVVLGKTPDKTENKFAVL